MPPLLIGNIKSVVGHQCEVLLLSELKSMHVTHDGIIYSVGQLGSYVIIPTAFEKIVGIVTETRLLEVVSSSTEDQVFPSDKKVLKVSLIGTISEDRFERGVREFPLINDQVFLARQEDYDIIFGGEKPPEFIEIGSFSDNERFRIPLDVDKLLSKPVALVGTTGTGKSYAVASFIHKVLGYRSTRIIILDLHGEYTTCFGENARVLSIENGLEIPYWLFNYQELQELCIDRNEREAPNQAVIFKQKVIDAKKTAESAENLQLGDSFSVDSPIFFDIQHVYEAIGAVNEQMVPGKTGLKQGEFYGLFNRFLVRLDSRLSDYRYRFLFRPSRYTSSSTLKQFVEEVLGRGTTAAKVTVIDLSGVPSDVVESVVGLLTRIAFDFTFWNTKREDNPVLLVCEEAHNYVARDRDSVSRRMIERVAKEGRKYGVGLMVVSQRPSELSETVLAQCNNFIVLRLTNPKDQEYIRALVTDQYENLLAVLPALRRGEALILGDAVLMPVRVRVDVIQDEKGVPRSHDVSFYRGWNSSGEINVEGIIEAWRRQRKQITAKAPAPEGSLATSPEQDGKGKLHSK